MMANPRASRFAGDRQPGLLPKPPNNRTFGGDLATINP